MALRSFLRWFGPIILWFQHVFQQPFKSSIGRSLLLTPDLTKLTYDSVRANKSKCCYTYTWEKGNACVQRALNASISIADGFAPPPFLIVHGRNDRTVLPNQARSLFRSLANSGAKVSQEWHNLGHACCDLQYARSFLAHYTNESSAALSMSAASPLTLLPPHLVNKTSAFSKLDKMNAIKALIKKDRGVDMDGISHGQGRRRRLAERRRRRRLHQSTSSPSVREIKDGRLFGARIPQFDFYDARSSSSSSPHFASSTAKQTNQTDAAPLPPPPPSSPPPPLLVWLHGGAWLNGGTTSDVQVWIDELWPQGWALASLGYLHSGRGGGSEGGAVWPAQGKGPAAALLYLHHQRHMFHFDRQKVVVAGFSSGGHLASILATRSLGSLFERREGGGMKTAEAKSQPSPLIHGVVIYSGPSKILDMDYDIDSQVVSKLDHYSADAPESRLVGCSLKDHIIKIDHVRSPSLPRSQAAHHDTE